MWDRLFQGTDKLTSNISANFFLNVGITSIF